MFELCTNLCWLFTILLEITLFRNIILVSVSSPCRLSTADTAFYLFIYFHFIYLFILFYLILFF